jgi:hypothetical protein
VGRQGEGKEFCPNGCHARGRGCSGCPCWSRGTMGPWDGKVRERGFALTGATHGGEAAAAVRVGREARWARGTDSACGRGARTASGRDPRDPRDHRCGVPVGPQGHGMRRRCWAEAPRSTTLAAPPADPRASCHQRCRERRAPGGKSCQICVSQVFLETKHWQCARERVASRSAYRELRHAIHAHGGLRIHSPPVVVQLQPAPNSRLLTGVTSKRENTSASLFNRVGQGEST